jgi:acyl carrier protein
MCDLSSLINTSTELTNLPIGRPIAHTKAYVLDNYGNVLPPGLVGELCISGPGVARGYVNDPEMNDALFQDKNPIENTTYKFYKTGDLVRYRPDGLIEFISRKDRMIKYHGFRVEPAEIERIIMQHPEVHHCVVMLKSPHKIQNQLAAYIIAHGNCSTSMLKRYLENKLPDYQIPSVFVFIDAFPLNRSGKINTQLLPVPVAMDQDMDMEYVLPGTETEKQLAAIWHTVFNRKKISINTSFFVLGDDSLHSLTLISRIENYFNIKLTVKILFNNSCIKKLARIIDKKIACTVDNNDNSSPIMKGV